MMGCTLESAQGHWWLIGALISICNNESDSMLRGGQTGKKSAVWIESRTLCCIVICRTHMLHYTTPRWPLHYTSHLLWQPPEWKSWTLAHKFPLLKNHKPSPITDLSQSKPESQIIQNRKTIFVCFKQIIIRSKPVRKTVSELCWGMFCRNSTSHLAK